MQKINPHGCGFHIFVKKNYFRLINGFDETVVLAEDHDLIRRAWKKGARFGILHPKIKVSVRRLEKEGRIRFLLKMFYAAFYRTFFGEIKRGKIKYEFGHK